MQLNIKYFGFIAEITRCNKETLELSNATIGQLKEVLVDRYPELNTMDFQIAQNKEIVSSNTNVSGEEIAILPPFSGG